MHDCRLVLDFDGRRLTGLRPFARLEVRNGFRQWWGDGHPFRKGDNIFDAIRNALIWAREKCGSRGAAIGFVGYDAAREWMPRAFGKQSPANNLHRPELRLTFCEELRDEPAPNPTIDTLPDEEYSAPPVPDEYRAAIERIRKYIAAGDIYQANFTQRFQAPLAVSPATLYEKLQQSHPARFGALLQWDDFALVSNSPERFLKLEDRLLTAQPIKGTTRRGSTASWDKERAQALLNSAKDRAENVMIVDLLRNDLGRVCEYGSVQVPKLFELQTLPTLHHLVSTITGTLRGDCDGLDAFRAAFPCGSITGAPKMRAMQIIDELEPVRRGAAMGAIGYFGFDGAMDWNVAIRTITCLEREAYFHVGGGIVEGSNAEDEYAEMRLKARAMETALGAKM